MINASSITKSIVVPLLSMFYNLAVADDKLLEVGFNELTKKEIGKIKDKYGNNKEIRGYIFGSQAYAWLYLPMKISKKGNCFRRFMQINGEVGKDRSIQWESFASPYLEYQKFIWLASNKNNNSCVGRNPGNAIVLRTAVEEAAVMSLHEQLPVILSEAKKNFDVLKELEVKQGRRSFRIVSIEIKRLKDGGNYELIVDDKKNSVGDCYRMAMESTNKGGFVVIGVKKMNSLRHMCCRSKIPYAQTAANKL